MRFMRAHRTGTLRLLVLAVVLALGTAGCGSDDGPGAGGGGETQDTTASGATPKTIKQGTLTVCSDIPYAPFEFEDQGKIVGIDIDLVRAVAERLKLQAAIVDTDFDAIFAALNAGKCDVVASSVSITEERKKTLDFSEGYFEINQSLLVRKADADRYKDLESLKGRSVAVQSGTTGADFAKENARDAAIKEFTGADEMFTALKAGQVDGVVQDFPVNAYNAKTTGETVVSKVFTESDKEQYGIVIPKGKDELKEAIDGALSAIKSDGTYETILRTYLGDTTGRV